MKNWKIQYSELLLSKTMKSVSVLLSANILNAVLGFVSSVVVLRFVDKESIAVVYPLVSILLIVSQFGDLGLSNSFIKYGSKFYSVDRFKSLKFFSASLRLKGAIGLIVTILSFPFVKYIADSTFHNQNFNTLIQWTLVVSALQIFSSYSLSAMQIEGKFRELSFLKVFPSFLKMLLLLVLVYSHKASLELVFIAFMLPSVLTFALAFFLSDHAEILKIKAEKSEYLNLLHMSKWLALSAFANALLGQLDVLMIRSMGGVDEFGKLAGGQKLAGVFPVLTVSAVTILLPKVSGMNTKKELNYFVRKSLKVLIPLAMLFLLFLPLSYWAIPFVLGGEYKSSISVFNILMLANVIGMIVTPISLVLYNQDRERSLAIMNVTQLIINLIGNYLFIPLGGADGASWVTVLSKIFAATIVFYELWRSGVLNYQENKNV